MRPDTYTGDDSGCVFGPYSLGLCGETTLDETGTMGWPAPRDRNDYSSTCDFGHRTAR